MWLRMAWRNVWRNGRRTGIVVSAVAIGIGACLFSMSLSFGVAQQMVATAIETQLGHLQIHAQGIRHPVDAIEAGDDRSRLHGRAATHRFDAGRARRDEIVFLDEDRGRVAVEHGAVLDTTVSRLGIADCDADVHRISQLLAALREQGCVGDRSVETVVDCRRARRE